MANKLTPVVDNIEAAYQALVTAGTIKKVERGVVNMLTYHNPPVAAISVSNLRRRDSTWLCDLVIQLLAARESTTDPDEAVVDLIAEGQAALDALRAAGTAGAYIAEPRWDCWYSAGSQDVPIRPAGAIGMTTVRIDGALKSS